MTPSWPSAHEIKYKMHNHPQVKNSKLRIYL